MSKILSMEDLVRWNKLWVNCGNFEIGSIALPYDLKT